MRWTYQISAAAKPRVLLRVAQVFEQQTIALQRLVLEEYGGALKIKVTVEAEEELARRVHAKLYKQLDMLHIELLAERSTDFECSK